MLLSNYGNVLNRQGKYQPARDCFLEGIRESQTLNNSMVIAYLVIGLAGNQVLSGDAAKAAQLMGAAEGYFEAVEVTSMAAVDQFDYDYYLAQIQASLEQEELNDLWEKGKGMSIEETVAYALNH